jgi:exodeoxyribonuclease V alpha subunit
MPARIRRTVGQDPHRSQMAVFPSSPEARQHRRHAFRGRALAALRARSPAQLLGQDFAGRLTLERVLHASREGSFHLLLVTGEALRQLGLSEIALACRGGAGFDLLPGMRLDIEGVFAAPRDRIVLEARRLARVAPGEDFGLEAWLRSAGIKGLGPHRAAVIAQALGADWRAGMLEPVRLAAGKGVSSDLAAAIAAQWQADLAANEVRTTLLGLGLRPVQAQAVLDRHGGAALAILEEDPWRLAQSVPGIGFEAADLVAHALGMGREDSRRLRAGCSAALEALLDATGSTRLSEMDVVRRATTLLDADEEPVATALQALLDEATTPLCVCPHSGRLGLQRLAEREIQVAGHVRRLARGRGLMHRAAAEAAIAAAEAAAGLSLDRDAGQFEAAVMALSHGVSVITGGPGTGKSTVLRVVVRAAEQALRLAPDHEGITLAAPTGRAARRLRETTGRRAATIHQTLRIGAGDDEASHGPDDPLPAELVIVDEASMLDLELAEKLLRAVRGSLVLVGDVDQLASVGPGQVLRDVIESGAVPVTALTRVRRTEAGVEIPAASARIRAGLHPVPDGQVLAGVHLVEVEDALVPDRLGQLLGGRLAALGVDAAADVQILAAMRRGACGVWAINEEIKRILVPDRAGETMLGGSGYAVGDRVMAVRNNPRTDVSNGDIGTVLEAHPGAVRVIFPDRPDPVLFTREDADQLMHARASTIHKSQGSEFACVVVVVADAHGRALNRNLLYTAVSRAKRDVVIVGPRSAVLRAVATPGAARSTDLCRLLRLPPGELDGEPRAAAAPARSARLRRRPVLGRAAMPPARPGERQDTG